MRYRHFSSFHQLALASVGFVAFMLLLDTSGLHAWATHLDLGPERTVAAPLTDLLARLMHPLHTDALRRRELAFLGRAGWSDDPADTATGDTASDNTAPTPAEQPPHGVATSPGAVGHPSLPTTAVASVPAIPPALGTTLKNPPLTRAPLHLAPLPPAAPTRTVALAGDSMMAVGLAPNLLNHAPQHPDLRFVKTYKSGTGLARPEVFNWQKEYPAMLGTAHPDVIVVAIGANDGQGFVEGKTTYLFGTDAWQQVYAARVEAYLHMLESDGAEVLWLGLPPMKSANYDAHTALVNRIAYAVVLQHPHVLWVSLAGLVGDETGGFREYAPVGERIQPLRQPDGIHLSDAGASLVTAELLPWLAPPPATPPAAPPTTPSTAPAAPTPPSPASSATTSASPTSPGPPSRKPPSVARPARRPRPAHAQPRRSR